MPDSNIKHNGLCEEASPLSYETYIPCGRPARHVMRSEKDARDYWMCDTCADHSTRRGMIEVRLIEPQHLVQLPKSPEPVDFNPDDLAADAAAQRRSMLASTTTLDDIRALAEQQLLLMEELEAMEAQHDLKKAELRKLSEETLPELLNAVGLPGLKLADGTVVELVDNISASITDENRDEAHKWLRENGYGDIIKNVVAFSFGKGEDDDAKVLLAYANEMAKSGQLHFGTLDQKEAVHSSTLKAFVKEQLKQGTALPAAAFKLYVGQATKIKKAKSRS